MVVGVPKSFPELNELLTDHTQSILVALKFPYDTMTWQLDMMSSQYHEMQDRAIEDGVPLYSEDILARKKLISTDFSSEVMQALKIHISLLPPELQKLFEFHKGVSAQHGTRYRLVIKTALVMNSSEVLPSSKDWVLKEGNRLVHEFSLVKKELIKGLQASLKRAKSEAEKKIIHDNALKEGARIQKFYQGKIDKIKYASSLSSLGPLVTYNEIIKEFQALEQQMVWVEEALRRSEETDVKLLQTQLEENLGELQKRVHNKLMIYERSTDKADKMARLNEISKEIDTLLKRFNLDISWDLEHEPTEGEH